MDSRGVFSIVLIHSTNGCTFSKHIVHRTDKKMPGFPILTKELIGELAAERVVRRIENEDEIPLLIQTPTHLVVRQSFIRNSRR